jgi:hypothetical protein
LRKQNLTESNPNPTHTLTWGPGLYRNQNLIVQPRGHNFQDDLYLYMEMQLWMTSLPSAIFKVALSSKFLFS